MLRGRVRKFAISQEIELLIENATDTENAVRFAIGSNESSQDVSNFITKLIPDAKIDEIMKDVVNPVLSKLKVNKEERYEILE